MSSILTNTGAMTALQTLKGISAQLNTTQSQIATGKSVGSAKDNAAVWAISKVMESDVSGFQAISASLSQGATTVAVASTGANQIVDILKDMKKLVVNATGAEADRGKITASLDEMKKNITSIIGASQFNGVNLLKTPATPADATIKVLSSIDRDAAGVLTPSTIDVASVDFGAKLNAAALATIDTTDATTATASISALEGLLKSAVDGAAALGSSAARIDRQSDFVGKLTNSMKVGIGAMVDADMEEASARLQALQVQQQLGTQALSIANQQPQSLMALFR